jgi:adenylosuccinate lyase
MNSILFNLSAISPIDGRYFLQTKDLSKYFSELALIKYRLKIEIEYLIFLSKIKISPKFSDLQIKLLRNIYLKFDIQEAIKIKKIETLTKHDLKAIEYYLRKELKNKSISKSIEWIHFGITSNDINDNAYRLMISDSLKNCLIPSLDSIRNELKSIAIKYKFLPFLGRTHGQPAIPTTFGKEIAVFLVRLNKELEKLRKIKLYGKFSGAIGNWNALYFAYPQENWPKLSTKFLNNLGLNHSYPTTQSAPNEDIVETFQILFRINSIFIDLNQDMWRYISDNWVIQKGKLKDVGSSTMPQKINPIEFENSEGNLILANGIFETLSRKLPISRLQRDLSDSTVLRNIGVTFAHCLIGYKSLVKGLESIELNKQEITNCLNANWAILTEAIQTILRKENVIGGYEKIAEKVRGKTLDQENWINLIDSLELSRKNKETLKKLTPNTYIGHVKF